MTVTHPRLNPVQLPLVGKYLSNNSATRILLRCAKMAGISSTRSWVALILWDIPRDYLNSHFLARTRAKRQLKSTIHSNFVRGTHTYMAPEAFDAVYNEQVDLWAVGVILHQMLVGSLPFPQEDEAALIKAILMSDPMPLPQSVPRSLRRVVAKAMAKDPAQRFQSAAEMRDALTPESLIDKEKTSRPSRHIVTIDEPPRKRKSDIFKSWRLTPNPIVAESEPEHTPARQQRRESRRAAPLLQRRAPQREMRLPFRSLIKPKRSRWRSSTLWGAGVMAIVIALAIYLDRAGYLRIGNLSLFRLSTSTAPSPSGPTKSPAKKQKPLNLGEAFSETLNGVKLEMRRVPGGKFLMGSPENDPEGSSDRRPQHRVTVPSFYMGKYEVTQAQWQAVMGNNPSTFKGDNLPVETISWNDAKGFCEKLSRMTGKTYRLPSEAEWEYACRARATGANASNLDAIAWYQANSGGKTHPVGHKQSNSFGLFDMLGNVTEWCEDVPHNDYNGAPTDGSAWLSGGGGARCHRGSAWDAYQWLISFTHRNSYSPGVPDNHFGVRVALSAMTP